MAALNIPILGVTGAVAAGKSAFARGLAALGAVVLDADAMGHRALARDEIRSAVILEFGRSALAPDGSLDRAALARAVFADAGARKRLEAIVHPAVRTAIDAQIAVAASAGAPLVVLDCALLFESGLDEICDATVAVEAPEPVRMSRALAAHGWDEAEVRRRMAAQFPPETKRLRAGRVVVNDGCTVSR